MKCRSIAFFRWSRVYVWSLNGEYYMGLIILIKMCFWASWFSLLFGCLRFYSAFHGYTIRNYIPRIWHIWFDKCWIQILVLISRNGTKMQIFWALAFTKTKPGIRRTFFSSKSLQFVFKDNDLRPHLEGELDDITDTDKIQSANCYLQSLNEKFESLLKTILREFFLNSELPRDTHRNKLFFYSQSLILEFFICCLQGITLFMILAELKKKNINPFDYGHVLPAYVFDML